jgi:hypothetical protein
MNFQPRAAKMRQPFARDLRVRVFNGRYYALDSGLYESVRAGRRAAMMCVRLKRNVSSPAPCALARLFKLERIRVLDALVKIEAFARDFARLVNDYAADQRARAHLSLSARRQLKRAAHHTLIKVWDFVIQTGC